MLTTQEVEERVFPKAKKAGYDMQDVDNFLDQLTADYTELYKENAVLKRKMKVLADKITEYQETEGAMRATLLASQKMADQLVDEAKTILCGTKGGADMLGEGGALRINGEKYSKLYTEIPDLKASGAAFFEGVSDNPAEVEARMWIDHVKDDSKPLITKPEQAYVVTQILEAIYRSAETNRHVYFEKGELKLD